MGDGLRRQDGKTARRPVEQKPEVRRDAPSPTVPHHPTSTYRVQLNAGFTFDSARAIVPYLADLGVSTLYTSPFLRATTGSAHGYDVTDYAALNPEIGDEEDLNQLSADLHKRGMGLLVDVVPNHMGIAGGANAWWQDVLEHGRTSSYADFFDIDWRPLKEELRGKILLPVLGEPYGVVLERGELRLALHAQDGAFTVHYYDTPFPIAPPTYPLILTAALDTLLPAPGPTGGGLGVRESDPDLQEFQSIITAFERLPGQLETDPDLVAERRREQIVAKRRLAEVAARSPEITAALEEAVAAINGDPAHPHSFDALDRLLDAQSYRLSSFRTAGEEINYRRFFAINDLAAVRQEVGEVFQAAQSYLMRLIASGVVTGLRIDHPDGLWDPAGYFRDVQRAAWRAQHADDPGREREAIDWEEIDPILADLWPGQAADGAVIADRLPLYVTVEKILEPGEVLPNDWAVHGTVGYEFARVTTGLFIDGEQRRAFDQLYTRFTQERRAFATVAYDAKHMMLRTALASETNVLARALNRLSEENRRTRDLTLSTLRYALREVISGFPIYRTYVICNGRGVPERDRRAIERAVALAKRRNPGVDPSPFDFLRDVLLLEDATTTTVSTTSTVSSPSRGTRDLDSAPDALPAPRESSPALGMTLTGEPSQADQPAIDARCHFVMKFQQLTGPVMAKGVEDTAFYIYNRLIALNEVGGDPGTFGASVSEFHRQNQERARRWPHAMLTSSTHDTKRSEDVRARIAVLSELPREWRAAVNRWARFNRRHKTRLEGQPAPDRNDEYLFYQILLGAWPWGAAEIDEEFIARIEAVTIKAARESQRHTSWVNQDADYERALTSFVRAALDRARRNPFLDDLPALRAVVARVGAFNALAQQLLKLTAPGVPDIYQGTELWDQSLVDPDNRRPVDYQARRDTLRALKRRKPSPRLAAELLNAKDDGRIKLYLTSRTLAYRQQHPDLFARGDYLPLTAEGSAADHVVAFLRRDAEREIVVAAPRLVVGLVGKEQVDPIGEGVWGDTRLALPDGEVGTLWRDLFTGETIEAGAAVEGAMLAMSEVFAHVPFALVERGR